MAARVQRGLPLFTATKRTEDRERSIGESTWEYLEKSAHVGDDLVRAQLEQLVTDLPTRHHHDVVSRLRDKDDRRVKDVVTELIVHRGLLEAGRTDIEVAPETTRGETDYRLASLAIHLEVTRIGESDDAHGDRQRRYQVIKKLNDINCGRFSLAATFDSGRQVPSVKEIRSAIEGWLAGLDASAERQSLETQIYYEAPTKSFDFGDWKVHLRATPLAPGAPPETIIGTIRDRFDHGPVTVESVRKSLQKKRKQHSTLDEPLIIVLDITAGHASNNLLADALYGARPLVGWERPADSEALWPTPARSGVPPPQQEGRSDGGRRACA